MTFVRDDCFKTSCRHGNEQMNASVLMKRTCIYDNYCVHNLLFIRLTVAVESFKCLPSVSLYPMNYNKIYFCLER